MPKLNKPVHGVRVEDISTEVQEILDNAFESVESEGASKSLFLRINGGLCCNDIQEEWVKSKLDPLFADAVSIDSLRKNKSLDPDDQTRAIAICLDRMEEVIDNLVPIINSFRLDCHNCLNANCASRDPNCPVEEAQKRDEELEEIRKRAKESKESK